MAVPLPSHGQSLGPLVNWTMFRRHIGVVVYVGKHREMEANKAEVRTLDKGMPCTLRLTSRCWARGS